MTGRQAWQAFWGLAFSNAQICEMTNFRYGHINFGIKTLSFISYKYFLSLLISDYFHLKLCWQFLTNNRKWLCWVGGSNNLKATSSLHRQLSNSAMYDLTRDQTWNLSKNLHDPIFGRKNFTHWKRLNWGYFRHQ